MAPGGSQASLGQPEDTKPTRARSTCFTWNSPPSPHETTLGDGHQISGPNRATPLSNHRIHIFKPIDPAWGIEDKTKERPTGPNWRAGSLNNTSTSQLVLAGRCVKSEEGMDTVVVPALARRSAVASAAAMVQDRHPARPFRATQWVADPKSDRLAQRKGR